MFNKYIFIFILLLFSFLTFLYFREKKNQLKRKGKERFESLKIKFDSLLFQIEKGNTIENIEKGITYIGLEKVKEWKSRFGYEFNIYSNDHPIEKEPHFHLDNKTEGVSCKLSFSGKVFSCKNKGIPKKITKELKYFLDKEEVKEILKNKWNYMNPKYKV